MKIFETFRSLRNDKPNSAAFLITAGDRSVPITWRQFTDDIATISWIIETNMTSGIIALIGENSYEWMVAHAACVFSGATVVPLDVNLTADEIISRLKTVNAAVLVHSALYSEKAREVQRKMPGLAVADFGSRKTEIFLNAGRRAIDCGFRTIWDREFNLPVDHTSMIVFTSGTTAEPRGVELTYRGLEVFAECAIAALPMKNTDRSLMLLPLYHIFGVCSTYLMLMRGVALGVCPDFHRLFDAVERFRVNFLFLVPALAEILAAKIDHRGETAESALGGSLDWVLLGGAPLPRRTYEHLTALGIRTLTGYGLTETMALYSIAPLDGDIRVGSAGKVPNHPEVQTKVSESGELMIKGPNVFKRYFNLPEKTASVKDADGWYNTGDIGTIDEDGYVWITGRASRTIVLSSGKKVAPEELEEKLLAIPGIFEAVVSGNGADRTIRAEVYGRISESAILRAVGQLNLLLPVYKRISETVVRKEPFPRTSSGKIRV